jgi:hypothetical protein
MRDPLFETAHSFMTVQMKSSFHFGSAIPEKRVTLPPGLQPTN